MRFAAAMSALSVSRTADGAALRSASKASPSAPLPAERYTSSRWSESAASLPPSGRSADTVTSVRTRLPTRERTRQVGTIFGFARRSTSRSNMGDRPANNGIHNSGSSHHMPNMPATAAAAVHKSVHWSPVSTRPRTNRSFSHSSRQSVVFSAAARCMSFCAAASSETPRFFAKCVSRSRYAALVRSSDTRKPASVRQMRSASLKCANRRAKSVCAAS